MNKQKQIHKRMKKLNKMGTIGVISLVLGLLGILTSVGTNIYNNVNTSDARQQNFELNENAAQNADKRTRNLYTDFESPQAQYDQLKAAGLSPSLFYSKNGAGGGITSTGAMGQGVAGLAPSYLSMGSPKEMAETALLQAQTRKVQEETKTEAGINTKGAAVIDNLIAMSSNAKANTELTKLKSTYQEYENYIKDNTKEFDINTALHYSQKMANESQMLFWEYKDKQIKFEIDDATKQDQINQIYENVNNTIADTNAKLSRAKLNDKQIQYLQQCITASKTELIQKWGQLNVNEQNADNYEKLVNEQISKLREETKKVTTEKEFIEKSFSQKERFFWAKLIGDFVGDAMHLVGMMQ